MAPALSYDPPLEKPICSTAGLVNCGSAEGLCDHQGWSSYGIRNANDVMAQARVHRRTVTPFLCVLVCNRP
jgi:hypothetical protein